MKELFGFENLPNLPPRFNVAPTQPVAIVRQPESGSRELASLRWGLIPHWAKDASMASKMINARAETVDDKPVFREAFARRRCLVPVDGFYEWRMEDGKKQPFRIGMKGGDLFAFAGLYEGWEATEDAANWSKGELIETFTIITTTANEKLQPIHARMPVILPPDDYEKWLSPANDSASLKQMLRPYPAEPMAFYRVGMAVNNVRNDGPDVIEPLRKATG